MLKDIIMTLVIGYASWIISVFSFSQIFGSFQHCRERGLIMTMVTVIIHTIIITLVVLAILKWFARYKIVALIGAIIGIIMLPSKIE